METIIVSKIDAASRQLDVAIRLLFAPDDIVAVHTLAGAASDVLWDLIERRAPEKSWDELARVANGLDEKTYKSVKHKTQNFLKHGDRDSDDHHEFRATDTAAIIMSAVMNLGARRTAEHDAIGFPALVLGVQHGRVAARLRGTRSRSSGVGGSQSTHDGLSSERRSPGVARCARG